MTWRISACAFCVCAHRLLAHHALGEEATFTPKAWKDKLAANAGGKFMYETTLKALKALDARFDPPAATLTFSMGVCVAANDGQTCFGEVSCDDPNCTQQIFGNTATTRAEFSVAKHVLVHEKRKLTPQRAVTVGDERTDIMGEEGDERLGW